MDYTLNFLIGILMSIIIMKIIINVINQFGIDFVEIFQDLWKKIR